jgi:hypothetical protein
MAFTVLALCLVYVAYSPFVFPSRIKARFLLLFTLLGVIVVADSPLYPP